VATEQLPQRLDQFRPAHPEKRVLINYQDEAPLGQHGMLTARPGQGRLAASGDPPEAVRLPVRVQRRLTDEATGLIMPHVSTAAMNAFLAQLAAELPADAHAALVRTAPAGTWPGPCRYRRAHAGAPAAQEPAA